MLSRRERLIMAGAAAGLMVLLAVSASLRPNLAGQGTHQQLGLPPCSVQVLVGIRCPACGMTTAWANLMRGRLTGALQASVSGTLFAAMAVLAAPWLLVSALRGRCAGFIPQSDAVGRAALAVMTLMLVEWIIRLAVG